MIGVVCELFNNYFLWGQFDKIKFILLKRN